MGLTTGFNPATVIVQPKQTPLTAGPAPVYQDVPAGGFGVATPEDADSAARLERVRAGGQAGGISFPWRAAWNLVKFFRKPAALAVAGKAAAVGTVATTKNCEDTIYAATMLACTNLTEILTRKNNEHQALGLAWSEDRDINKTTLNAFIESRSSRYGSYLTLPVVDFMVEKTSTGYDIFVLEFDSNNKNYQMRQINISGDRLSDILDTRPHTLAASDLNTRLHLIRALAGSRAFFVYRDVELNIPENALATQPSVEIAYLGRAEALFQWTSCSAAAPATSAK